ncbi:MAG: LysR family transcriptional regulator [Limosilactobacillus sp.]
MNIDQIKLFIQVAELGSFKKAAEQNYTSQRAVSQQMKKLEDELNAQLFIRGHNSIQLTPAGKFFNKRCITITELLDDTSRMARSISLKDESLLSIGYFSPFDTVLIRDFMAKLPTIVQSSITEEGPEHILADLLLDKLDCGILMDNYGYKVDFKKKGLTAVTIHEDQMVIGVSTRLFNRLGKDFRLAALSDLPVIYYNNEESSYLKESFLASLSPKVKFSHVERTTSYEQMQLLVSLGKAISFYPQKLIARLSTPADQITYVLPPDYQDKKFQFKLIFKKTNHNPALRRLIKLLQ